MNNLNEYFNFVLFIVAYIQHKKRCTHIHTCNLRFAYKKCTQVLEMAEITINYTTADKLTAW